MTSQPTAHRTGIRSSLAAMAIAGLAVLSAAAPAVAGHESHSHAGVSCSDHQCRVTNPHLERVRGSQDGARAGRSGGYADGRAGRASCGKVPGNLKVNSECYRQSYRNAYFAAYTPSYHQGRTEYLRVRNGACSTPRPTWGGVRRSPPVYSRPTWSRPVYRRPVTKCNEPRVVFRWTW